MIKVVCLDLDGVFFLTPHSNLIKDLADAFDLEPSFLKEVLFHRAAKEGGYNDLKCGRIPSEQYWGWLFKALGLKGATAEDFLKIQQQGYTINPQAAELIDQLHAQNIKTAVCSNNFEDNIKRLKRNFNLEKYFDVLVFSYEVGVMKPERGIFRELIDRSSVPAQEIVFSDDKKSALQGARDLGIKTFLYTGFEDFKAELVRLGIDLTSQNNVTE